MCITHGHSQQCGDGQREEGRELEAKGQRRGIRTSAVVPKVKIK